MVQDMVAKKNRTLREKIHFYSAHDTTLLPFLHTLGVFNYILVPYSASVLVELRLKNKEYIVTVRTIIIFFFEHTPFNVGQVLSFSINYLYINTCFYSIRISVLSFFGVHWFWFLLKLFFLEKYHLCHPF